MTGVGDNIVRSDLIEHEDNLGMTELVQAKQSFCIELVRIDRRAASTCTGAFILAKAVENALHLALRSGKCELALGRVADLAAATPEH